MNPRSFKYPLEKSTSVSISINIIHEEVNNNSEELEKIQKLVDENKKSGHKIPLIDTVLLLFHNTENNTLKKCDLYSLMEKETINNKNTIISSPTERYCIINQKNYKSKIKDILKKKKWFTRRINDSNEIEYTLNPGVVSSIVPPITSFFKSLVENDYFFINEKEEEKEEEDKGKEEVKEEKQEKNVKKLKKGRKPKKANQKKLETGEETEVKKEKQKTEEKQVTEEKQEKEEKYENFVEGNNDNLENIIIGKEESEKEINKKKKNKKKFMANIKKEKNIQVKEEKIEDFEIIIEDDDENNNNISFTKTEQRTIIANVEGQKIENNDNNSDSLPPEYLNKKRKPRKKNVNNNLKIKTEEEEEEISSSIKDNKNLLKDENPENNTQAVLTFVKYLIENDSTKDEIDKFPQNNEIDSIINFGEIFLKLLKSKKLSELASKKVECLKEEIKNKEKEIQSDAKFIEEIKQKEKKVNSVNIKEIEKSISEIKLINEKYKEKNGKLSPDKNVCENTEIDVDKKLDNNNFKENKEIVEKIISEFSIIFNNYQNAGELLNMLLIDETRENKSGMNIGNIDNDFNENNENIFKKVINYTKTNCKIVKYDKYSDGKYIDLLNEENFNKANCENALDVGELNNNINEI